MSPAVIYDTSSPWIPPRSPPSSSGASFKRIPSPQLPHVDPQPRRPGSPMPEPAHGFQDYARSSCVSPYTLPVKSGINGIDDPQLTYVDNMLSASADSSVAYPHHPWTTNPAWGPRIKGISSHQVPSGNSRSARMRRALSVPTQDQSTVPAIAYMPRQIKPPADNPFFPIFPFLQPGQTQVIAEFSPREQYPLSNSGTPRFEPARTTTPSGNPALPPRLQTSPTPSSRSRSKPWRTAHEDLPPRFRTHQRSPLQPSNPPESPWSQDQPSPSSRQPNNLAISFNSHLSQPQHLSSFLNNNVSYASGLPCDTRPSQQPSSNLELSCQARTLAPIGAERAQRLASTANVMPSNLYSKSDNLKVSSRIPTDVGPPPGLSNSLFLPFEFNPHELCPQRLTEPNVPVNRFPRLEPTKDVACPQSQTELEKLFRRMQSKKNAPKISSPLSPFRNPDSWGASDGKWRREERDQRRRHILSSCETSVFRRKTSDRRSRTECEEFAYGIEVSEHCYWCRQDTLCKRLLIHRARDFVRSNSSSPVSDYSSSSEEGIDDYDESILITPEDTSPTPNSPILGKIIELEPITVVDAGNDENIAPDHTPAASSRILASSDLIHMDI